MSCFCLIGDNFQLSDILDITSSLLLLKTNSFNYFELSPNQSRREHLNSKVALNKFLHYLKQIHRIE